MYSARHQRRLINQISSDTIRNLTVQSEVEENNFYNPINNVNVAPNQIHNFEDIVTEESHSTELHISNSSQEDSNTDIETKLRDWAVSERVPLKTFSSLLKLLNQNVQELATLPSDARTLLKTPRKCISRNVHPGQYIHFGLKERILQSLKVNKYDQDDLYLDLSTDGLPLTKSSNSQFWPIQARIFSKFSKPIIVGIYHGLSKPSDCNEFLREVVDELKEILTDGILYNQRHFKVQIRAIIADAPARSFLLNTAGHSGYFACGKCEQRGSYSQSRVVYDTKTQQLRTDASFNQKTQKEHHNGHSILNELDVGLVSQVPVEYMHLVLQGVTKKLLQLWTHGKRLRAKLRCRDIILISSRLTKLRKRIPTEFARKPRPLSELSRWKCTELRLFLLYLSPIVLKGILKSKYYKHFLCFQVAIFILSSSKLSSCYLDYADKLLCYFVKNFPHLYGKEQVSYNVHNLLHLASDVKRFGPLDSFSAFPYESNLQALKSLVKGYSKPLQQVHRRIHELEGIRNQQNGLEPGVSLELPTTVSSDEYPSGDYYRRLKLPNFMVELNEANSYVEVDLVGIVKVKAIVRHNNNIEILGTRMKTKKTPTNFPCDFSMLGISAIDSDQGRRIQSWPLCEIRRNMVRYAVVEFEGSEMEVIPESWLQDNNKTCMWPNQRAPSSITTAINRAKSPEADWQSCDVVRVFGTYESALQAREKAKKFELNSDAGTDCGKRKRKPSSKLHLTTPLKGKKKQKFVTKNQETSESSHDELEDLPPAPLLRVSSPIRRELDHSEMNISAPSRPSTSQVIWNSTSPRVYLDGNETPGTTAINIPRRQTDSCCCSKGFQSELVSSISYLKVKMQEILTAQGAIQQQLNSTKRLAVESNSISLPLKTMNELEKLEENVNEDHSIYSELASKLDGLGGRNVRLCTLATMRRLLINDVAACLNWKGRNNKVAFEGYTICDIVANCVSYQFGKKDGNISDIKSAIQDWLKASKQRMSKFPAPEEC